MILRLSVIPLWLSVYRKNTATQRATEIAQRAAELITLVHSSFCGMEKGLGS
jgi:hypothetical protein